MEDRHLLNPLMPATTTAIPSSMDAKNNNGDDYKEYTINMSSNSSILLRLISVLFIGIVSIWANYEASKGFKITITNEAADSPAGKRFTLLYVSNDKATRMLLNQSKFIENLLYPRSPADIYAPANHRRRHHHHHNFNYSFLKKQINHVILGLASQNLTHNAIVHSSKEDDDQYVLHISPSVMEEIDVNHAMLSAVQQGMVLIWLYHDTAAPISLINGMVEYIISILLAAAGELSSEWEYSRSPESDNNVCWKDKDPKSVAHFLNYCEGHREGFIRRLNQAMKYGWHNRTVDDALGTPANQLCASYKSSSSSNYIMIHSNSLDSTSLILSDHVI